MFSVPTATKEKKVKRYVQKGYAIKINKEELKSNKTWYISHLQYLFKQAKIRLVFNAAARSISASDMLLPGQIC
jgi:hypothetical protein